MLKQVRIYSEITQELLMVQLLMIEFGMTPRARSQASKQTIRLLKVARNRDASLSHNYLENLVPIRSGNIEIVIFPRDLLAKQ